MIAHLLGYAEPDLAAKLTETVAISYHTYNWRLNEMRGTDPASASDPKPTP